VTTPAEVAANLERLAADAQRRALAQLSFSAATLGLLIECTRWTPDDAASLASCVEGFQARSSDGLRALGDMQKYRRALDNLQSEAVAELQPSALTPKDRGAKLDDLAAGMIETATVASGDLETLVDILRTGGPGAAEAICERMASFAARAQELQTIFDTAGEVAGCAASA
jgi:hypothetical protein